jgi:hypothetical protein
MKSIGLTMLVAAIVVFASPRSARACGSAGGSNALATALTVVAIVEAVDAGLTLWDGGSALMRHHPSMAYGFVELTAAAPQLLIGGLALVDSTRPNQNQSSTGGLLIYTGWMALLATHGIWTIATAGSAEPASAPAPLRGSEQPLLHAAAVAPRRLGFQLSVGPTYASFGHSVQPGIGVVGRF